MTNWTGLKGRAGIRTTTNKLGDFGETAAAGFLIAKGYAVLAQNYKRGGGEIDIIAKDGEYIVFVEVKCRKGLSKGLPADAVNGTKRRRLVRAALCYIAENGLDANFRFDVIEVFGAECLEINHIEDAFYAE